MEHDENDQFRKKCLNEGVNDKFEMIGTIFTLSTKSRDIFANYLIVARKDLGQYLGQIEYRFSLEVNICMFL